VLNTTAIRSNGAFPIRRDSYFMAASHSLRSEVRLAISSLE